jgi:hypothetical protein
MALPVPPSSAEGKRSFIGYSPPADPAFKPRPCPRATRKSILKVKAGKAGETIDNELLLLYFSKNKSLAL